MDDALSTPIMPRLYEKKSVLPICTAAVTTGCRVDRAELEVMGLKEIKLFKHLALLHLRGRYRENVSFGYGYFFRN